VIENDARVVFIDESGNSERVLVLTAISIPLEAVQPAHGRTEALIAHMSSILPPLAAKSELHGVTLSRELSVRDATALGEASLLSTYESDFVYQHALRHLSDIDDVEVYTLSWRWKGPARKKGDPRGWRTHMPLTRLLEWIVGENATSLAYGVVDGVNKHYEESWNAFRKSTEVGPLNMTASVDNRLIQLADLAAHAAFQMTNSDHVPQRRRWLRRPPSPRRRRTGSQEKTSPGG
jgi:hypothetical protein